MSKIKRFSIGMAILLPSLFVLIGWVTARAQEQNNSPFLPDSIVEKRVDSVMQTLTVREKIAQLMIIEYYSEDKPEDKAKQDFLVSKENVGGLILMWDVLPDGVLRTNELHRLAKTPLLVTIDAEWGMSMRYRQLPVFPRQMQLGAISSEELVYETGYMIGKECRDYNFHVNYASDIDVNNNSENPVINTRAFGEDKEKVAHYGAAFMKGMNAAGVYGSAKHFPGHGDTNVDSHKALPTLDFSYERLDSLELYPFKHLIAENADMIMVAHLSIPALDSTGVPASISKPIVTGLLKEKLGYKGIVITDALNMKGVSESLEKRKIALEAYKAGVDILLMPEEVSNSITEIEKALKRGEITMESLDERVRKVLTLKAKAGLFEKDYNPIVDIESWGGRYVKEENRAFIYKLAKESMTLVTNHKDADGEPVLPIKSLKEKKIAYLGYDAARNGKECAQVLMRHAAVDTLILRGPVKEKDLKCAKEKLNGYDLIILGINNTDARPQFNFGIDSVQMKFITDWAKEQDMVAMFLGNGYVLNKLKDYNNFKAFIIGYLNSLENVEAIAQIIFGAVPAKGVLPVTSGEFKAGHSVLLSEIIRSEYVYHSADSTYRMVEGKIYGNHLVKCSGDTLWYNEPVTICGDFLNEFLGEDLFRVSAKGDLEAFAQGLGMADTRFVVSADVPDSHSVDNASVKGKEISVVTTLDDMSKFFKVVMSNGIYGGCVHVPWQVRDRLILVAYTMMERDNGLALSEDGLKVWLDADKNDIKFQYVAN